MSQAGHDRAWSLLTLAVRWLPPERQDWGQAMLAELDQLQDRWARWRFALGCVRVVLAPPRATPTPGLAMRAAVVVGAVAMGVGISLVAPALQLFAVLFAVLLAGSVWLALRSRTAVTSRAGPGRILRAVLLTGVAAAVGVVLYGVVRYPGAVGEPWDPVLILLSVTLAATLSGPAGGGAPVIHNHNTFNATVTGVSDPEHAADLVVTRLFRTNERLDTGGALG